MHTYAILVFQCREHNSPSDGCINNYRIAPPSCKLVYKQLYPALSEVIATRNHRIQPLVRQLKTIPHRLYDEYDP